jgi:hypothetical protein
LVCIGAAGVVCGIVEKQSFAIDGVEHRLCRSDGMYATS